MIGNGASAVQILPHLLDEAEVGITNMTHIGLNDQKSEII